MVLNALTPEDACVWLRKLDPGPFERPARLMLELLDEPGRRVDISDRPRLARDLLSLDATDRDVSLGFREVCDLLRRAPERSWLLLGAMGKLGLGMLLVRDDGEVAGCHFTIKKRRMN